VRQSNTEGELFIDGDLKYNPKSLSFTSPIDSLTVGGYYGDNCSGISLGELVIAPLLSDADRQKLEGYLAHKWGLQANLPADHPYKAAAPSASTKGRGATSK